MARFSIATVEEQDLETIARLAHEIWFAHYPGIITTRQIQYMLDRDYSIEALQESLRTQTAIDLLTIDDEPGGFAAYGPLPAASGSDDKIAEIRLHKLYLHPSFHGQGLGSTLLQHVEETCRKDRVDRLSLTVNKHNAVAIRAYKRNSYRIVRSVLTGIGDGFFVDDYIMARTLA